MMYAPATAADADCHYGDHYWQDNGYCSNCHAFNAGLLSWAKFEKAEREGRACDDHFHLTVEAKAACKTPVKYPADPTRDMEESQR